MIVFDLCIVMQSLHVSALVVWRRWARPIELVVDFMRQVVIGVNDLVPNYNWGHHQTDHLRIVTIVVIAIKLLHPVLNCTYMLILVPGLRAVRGVLLDIFDDGCVLIRCLVVVHRFWDGPVEVEIANGGRELWIDLAVAHNMRLGPGEIFVIVWVRKMPHSVVV